MVKICFVIGPIGDVGSVTRADADDFMQYVVTPCEALKEFVYGQPIRADQLSEPGRITSQVIKLLMDADLIIADLTGNNANVFYELSLRHAIGKPVIHMAAAGTPLSFDVRDNRTIFYTMHSRVAETARDELANQIRHVHSEGYKPMNPILETVSIINMERSSDPNQNALGQVMNMLESLGGEMKSMRSAIAKIQTDQTSLTLPYTARIARALAGETLVGSLINGPTGPGSGVGILSDALAELSAKPKSPPGPTGQKKS